VFPEIGCTFLFRYAFHSTAVHLVVEPFLFGRTPEALCPTEEQADAIFIRLATITSRELKIKTVTTGSHVRLILPCKYEPE